LKRQKWTLAKNTVIVKGSFGDLGQEAIADRLTSPLHVHGYTVSVERVTPHMSFSDFVYALPIAFGFFAFFVLLQKMGLVNLVGGGELGYGALFLIGVIASLSTCMAVVGGLLLSMSATFAKSGDRIRPQMLFHAGRLVAFFLLGGLIGEIGTVFTLGTGTTFVLHVIIGIVMLVLGINLLDVFHSARRFQFAMPAIFGRHVQGISRMNHTLTPLIVGVATFFLPCGFTQSMQLYALGSGGFLSGALTMSVFALGTLPVLLLVSFSSFTVAESTRSGIFYKTAGLIVIAFALMSIVNSFVIIGALPPIFNF
jgi:sulfite exporter TauE/SafE